VRNFRVLCIVIAVLLLTICTVSAQDIVLRKSSWESAVLMEQRIEQFEKEHPGIKVDFEPFAGGTAEFLEQVKIWAAAGMLPDVIPFTYWQYPELRELGILADISPYIDDVDKLSAEFMPQLLNAFMDDTGVYGLPFAVEMDVIIYNQEIFDVRAIPTPTELLRNNEWDVDALVNVARKHTQMNSVGSFESIGLYTSHSIPFLVPFIWAYGGEVLSEDGREILLNNPNTIKALEDLQGYYNNEKIFVSYLHNSLYGLDLWDTLGNWNTAMRLWWISTVNSVRILNEEIPWRMSPFPSGVTNETSLIIGHAVGVTVAAEDPEAAWKYVNFRSSLPTRDDQMVLPAKLEHLGLWAEQALNFFNIPAYEFIEQVGDRIRLSPRATSSKVEDAIRRQLDNIIAGRSTVMVAVEEAVRLGNIAMEQ